MGVPTGPLAWRVACRVSAHTRSCTYVLAVPLVGTSPGLDRWPRDVDAFRETAGCEQEVGMDIAGQEFRQSLLFRLGDRS